MLIKHRLKHSGILFFAAFALAFIAQNPDAKCDGLGGYFNPSRDHTLNFGIMGGGAGALTRLDGTSSPFSFIGGVAFDTHLHNQFNDRVFDANGNLFLGEINIVPDLSADARVYLLNRSEGMVVQKNADGSLDLVFDLKTNPDLMKVGGGVGGIALFGRHQVALMGLELAINALRLQRASPTAQETAKFWFLTPELRLRFKIESLADLLDLGLTLAAGAGFPINNPDEDVANVYTSYNGTSMVVNLSGEFEGKVHFLERWYTGLLGRGGHANFSTTAREVHKESGQRTEEQQRKATTFLQGGLILGLSF